jgi:hypothetical protein
MPSWYHFAFWNLENLFDVENSPRRNDKIKRAIQHDIRGWTQALLDRKVAQLASIIQKMKRGQGPDMLGICEVENQFVVDQLVSALSPLGRNYKVVHHDTDDQRGIDVAFIYDADLFQAGETFNHFVMRRTATRNILQVNFQTQKGRTLVVLANHWPSRSGGQLESEAYREIAGETLAYFHQRILEVLGADTPVLAMGDFNDEPFDRSLRDYALALRSETKVVNGRNPYFLNLMWPIMGQSLGSLYFDNTPNLLDQFLVNKNMVKQSGAIRALPGSANILRFPEMVHEGEYPTPIPFGGMGKPLNQEGFSDHFPIELALVEED